MTTITAPDTSSLEKLFKGDLTCKMVYGTKVCGAPAQYKIIMACCGASDFLCAECYTDAMTPPLPRGMVIKAPGKIITDQPTGYFGCSACYTLHNSFKDAVKETIRI